MSVFKYYGQVNGYHLSSRIQDTTTYALIEDTTKEKLTIFKNLEKTFHKESSKS